MVPWPELGRGATEKKIIEKFVPYVISRNTPPPAAAVVQWGRTN
jgi:hypothetical protein